MARAAMLAAPGLLGSAGREAGGAGRDARYRPTASVKSVPTIPTVQVPRPEPIVEYIHATDRCVGVVHAKPKNTAAATVRPAVTWAQARTFVSRPFYMRWPPWPAAFALPARAPPPW